MKNIQKVEIGDICKIESGKKDVNEGHPEGKYPFFTCADKPLKSNSYSYDTEAILLPGNGANVGLVMYYNGPFELYQRTYVLHKFNEGIFPFYVFLYLRRYWSIFNNHLQYGSATNYIRYDNIAKFKIPLPPVEEQKLIAVILDKADTLRQKRKESIRLLDEFLRSVFLDMFGDPVANPKGWELKKLGEVIKTTQYGISKKSNSDGIGTPILGMSNITYDGFIDLTTIKTIKLSNSEIEKYTLKPDDLLFNRTNSPELVGKTTVWDGEGVYIFAGYLVRIKFKRNKANPYFISSFLNSIYGKQMLYSKAKDSINMSNISPTLLSEFKIPIPRIELQNSYEIVYKKVQNQKKSLITKIFDYDNLFNSLVQRAFCGEL